MKISVVIPVHNAEKTLERCVVSITNQTVQPYKILIINDGSTDKTDMIIDGLLKNYRNIESFYQENLGVSAARNLGIHQAKSSHIMFLDSDDYWLPDKIKNHIDHLKKHPNCHLSFSNFFIEETYNSKSLKANTKKNRLPVSKKTLALAKTSIHGSASSVICKTSDLKLLGGFDEQLAFGEDLDMWIRIAENHEICELKNFDVVIVESKQSSQKKLLSQKRNWLVSDTYLYIWKKNNLFFKTRRDKKDARVILRTDLRRNFRVISSIIIDFPRNLKGMHSNLYKQIYKNHFIYLFFLVIDARFELILILKAIRSNFMDQRLLLDKLFFKGQINDN